MPTRAAIEELVLERFGIRNIANEIMSHLQFCVICHRRSAFRFDLYEYYFEPKIKTSSIRLCSAQCVRGLHKPPFQTVKVAKIKSFYFEISIETTPCLTVLYGQPLVTMSDEEEIRFWSGPLLAQRMMAGLTI